MAGRVAVRRALLLLAALHLAAAGPRASLERPTVTQPLVGESLPAAARSVTGATLAARTRDFRFLSHRFPEQALGPVVLKHRDSGLSLAFRPKGIFLEQADGTRTLVAVPEPVPAVPEGDGLDYRGLFPSVSHHYTASDHAMQLELRFEAPPAVAGQGRDRLLVTWSVDLERVGLIVWAGNEEGGILVLDEGRQPVFLITEPSRIDRPLSDPEGLSLEAPDPYVWLEEEPASQLGSLLEVVDGELEISLVIPRQDLMSASSLMPVRVELTTFNLQFDE